MGLTISMGTLSDFDVKYIIGGTGPSLEPGSLRPFTKDDLRRACASVCCRCAQLSNVAAVLVKEQLTGWWRCLTLMCCTCVLLSSLPRCFQFIPCQIFFAFFRLQCQTFSIHLQKKNKPDQKNPAELEFDALLAIFWQVWGVALCRNIVSALNVLIRMATSNVLRSKNKFRGTFTHPSIHYTSIHPFTHPRIHPSFNGWRENWMTYWCTFLFSKKWLWKQIRNFLQTFVVTLLEVICCSQLRSNWLQQSVLIGREAVAAPIFLYRLENTHHQFRSQSLLADYA